MRTLYKYTSKTMTGWQFVIVEDNGTDGRYATGNSASTVQNMSRYDLAVEVKRRRDLDDIVKRLDWLGKYEDNGGESL